MNTSSATDFLARGNSCYKQNKVADAVAWFRKAAKADPGLFAAHANLGNTLLQLNRYEEAVEAYFNALELKPAAPVVTRNLGECFEKTNRLDMAERYYRLAIELRPDKAETWVDLGNANQKQGNNNKALEHYRKALAIDPQLASAQHNIALCLYDDRDLGKAEDAFRAAVRMDPDNHLGACFLGILLEHQGKLEEAKDFLLFAEKTSPFNKCLIDSVRYAFSKGAGARFFSNTIDVLRYALSQSDGNGLFMEFGVYYGSSLNVIADATRETVHGFDSFEGLPESWFVGNEKGPLATEPSGAYSTRGVIPSLPVNAELHAGWFEDSLPEFVTRYDAAASFLNIDCDIYSSTKTIFQELKDRIRPGTVIVFDEYFCYPEWRDHEYKAFQEFMAETPFAYDYIAFSYFTGQAVVKILERG